MSAITNVKLRISKEVTAGETDIDFYIPPAGKTVSIVKFAGDGAFSQNSVVRLTWKNNEVEANRVHIWTIKGETKMPDQYEIPSSDTDGVRELAVCLENGEAGALFMSGYAFLKVQ